MEDIEKDSKEAARIIGNFKATPEEAERALRVLEIAAAKAGESLRRVFLSMKKTQNTRPAYKQWQPPYKYHR